MFRVVKFFELFFEERKNKYKVWFLFFNLMIKYKILIKNILFYVRNLLEYSDGLFNNNIVFFYDKDN